MFESTRNHLREVQESYPRHLATALEISLRLAGASMACAVHAIVPGLCTRTASRSITKIHGVLTSRAGRRDSDCELRRNTDPGR